MPSLVYLWKPGVPHQPKVGDYVLARMPKTGLGVGAREGDRIVKKIAAIAGDSVKVEGTELWINGKHAERLWLAKSIPGKAPGDFDAEFTTAAIAKYLNLKDTQAMPAGDNVAVAYTGGSNNDKIVEPVRQFIRYAKANGYKFDKITMETPQIHHGISN